MPTGGSAVRKAPQGNAPNMSVAKKDKLHSTDQTEYYTPQTTALQTEAPAGKGTVIPQTSNHTGSLTLENNGKQNSSLCLLAWVVGTVLAESMLLLSPPFV